MDDDDDDIAAVDEGEDDVMGALLARLQSVSVAQPEELASEFASLLGCERDLAIFFLQASNGSLETAINLFLDYQQQATRPTPPARLIGPPAVEFVAAGVRSSGSRLESDLVRQALAAGVVDEATAIMLRGALEDGDEVPLAPSSSYGVGFGMTSSDYGDDDDEDVNAGMAPALTSFRIPSSEATISTLAAPWVQHPLPSPPPPHGTGGGGGGASAGSASGDMMDSDL